LEYKIFGHSKDHIYLLGPTFFKLDSLKDKGESLFFVKELLGGVPFYDSALFSFSYPFYFFGLADFEPGISSLYMLTYIILFHLFILYTGNVVLLRSLSFKLPNAVLNSTILLLAMMTARNTAWIIAISGYAWIPLFFAGIIYSFRKNHRLLGVAVLSLSSLGFLAKPAQTAILAIFFGAILTFVGFVVTRKKTLANLKSFSISALLIVGINAVGLITIFLRYGEKMRFTPSGAVFGHAKIDLDAFDAYIPFKDLISFIHFRGIEFGPGHPYVGYLFMFLGLLGCYYTFKQKHNKQLRWAKYVFFSFFLLSFLFSLGKQTPLFYIHYHTPLLDKIREPLRFMFIGNIALSVLSAIALKEILQNWRFKYKIILLVIMGMLALFQFILTSSYSIFFAIPTLLIPVLLLLKIKNNDFFLVCLTAIIVIYFLAIPSGRYGAIKNAGVNNKNNLASMDIIKSISEEPNADLYRFAVNDKKIADGKWAQNSLYYGMRTFYASITPLPGQQFKEIYNADKYLNYRALWGTKYWVFDKKGPVISNRLVPNGIENEFYTVYKDPYARPLIYVATGLARFNGGAAGFKNFLSKGGKYVGLTCYLNDEVYSKYRKLKTKNQANKINLIEHKDGLIHWTADIPKEAIIVVNEYFNEDWKLYNESDEEIEIFKINSNQIGVYLTGGKYELKLKFQPANIYVLLIVQKVCFVFILALFLYYLGVRFKLKSVKSVGNEK